MKRNDLVLFLLLWVAELGRHSCGEIVALDLGARETATATATATASSTLAATTTGGLVADVMGSSASQTRLVLRGGEGVVPICAGSSMKENEEAKEGKNNDDDGDGGGGGDFDDGMSSLEVIQCSTDKDGFNNNAASHQRESADDEQGSANVEDAHQHGVGGMPGAWIDDDADMGGGYTPDAGGRGNRKCEGPAEAPEDEEEMDGNEQIGGLRWEDINQPEPGFQDANDMREALRGILRQPGVAARVRQRRKEEGFDQESEESEEEEAEEEEEQEEEKENKEENVEKDVVGDEEPGSMRNNDGLGNSNETQKQTKEGSQEPSSKTCEEEAASSMQRSAPLDSNNSDHRHTEIPASEKHVTAAADSSPRMSSEASAKLLMQLVKAGDLAGVKALIKQGVDVNSRCKDDEFEQTALHEAAERGGLPMVKVLLKAGANFKARDSIGSTPLHSAAAEGRTKVVKELLLWGANLFAANSVGMNAADEAERGNHAETLLMLEEHIQVLMMKRRYRGEGGEEKQAKTYEFQDDVLDQVLLKLERKEALQDLGRKGGKRKREPAMGSDQVASPREPVSDSDTSSTPPWFR